MSLWLLEYIRAKSLSKGRKVGCILLIAASFLFFCLAVGLNIVIKQSILIGFPMSLLTLCFGLGFRIGKGLKYLVVGVFMASVIVIITLVYNAK